jgi:phage gp29-like protein
MTQVLSNQRLRQHRQGRFNPIRNLDPATLSRHLDAFEGGVLRGAALLWETIERRDDILMSVAPKRKKAAAHRPWEVLTVQPGPEAEAHKASLEYFYNNLSTTHALDLNVRGGFSLLVRQMMDAVSKRYAVHYMDWKPTGAGVTAEFQFVPLWFFENQTGRLRFLREDHALDGEELAPGEWMVTHGDGLMEVCSVCYLFKHLPLKDWLIYCERHGMPGVHGKTAAAKDSAEWETMVEAVQAIGVDMSCVTGLEDKIEKIDMTANGPLPYQPIVERMDRAMATIWRGGDLSTLAKGDGAVGSNPQDEERDILVVDDLVTISETLNEYVDKAVIRMMHGTDRPLAYLSLTPPARQDVKQDLEVDRFLLDAGAPLALDDVLERYGRPMPEAGQALLVAANARTAERRAGAGVMQVAPRFEAAASRLLARARAQGWAPVTARLQALLDGPDAEFVSGLKQFQHDLPALAREVAADDATVAAWQKILGAALASGLSKESAA